MRSWFVVSTARAAAFASIAAAAIASSTAAFADTLPWTAATCSTGCNWSVDIAGTQVLSGGYDVDSDGNLHLIAGQATSATGPDGSSVQITSLSGNIDPLLSFGLGASTGALGKTFVFNFSMPISLSGTISASSSISYSLTANTAAGATIAPFLSSHVVIAQEVDSTGHLAPLNKGVDVGDSFSFLGGPAVHGSPVYSAANMFSGNSGYDLMSVTIAFSLSANSSVGLSGFVQQEAVPLPAALPLLFSGLGFLGLLARRSRANQNI